ncbi:MAG: leucine-rich repeat domain-containing protein [Clostridiales Family XIII bacterium]|jgi:hypothetical protein|nr:leucine-rich repeat domain-containing protein [Clostridiales Family XIII bacterium]
MEKDRRHPGNAAGRLLRATAFVAALVIAVASQPFSQMAADAAVPYVPGKERSPITAFAAQFIADCEGQQWLLDETERLLNMKQASIDYLAPDMLHTVTSIGLESRGIAGKIPKAIGHFTELTELLMSGNRLSGPLPDGLYALQKLKNVDLSGNLYQGPVPDGFARLPALEVLRLSGNAYTGGIPAALTAVAAPGDLPATLRVLDLSGNRLTGGVIPGLGSLSSLEYLDISGNPLGGDLPPAITGLAKLEAFLAWGCGLTGEIPAGIGGMAALKYLDLSHNSLAGAIPPGISALTDMRELSLTDNTLTGTLPDAFGAMAGLKQVHIDRNNIRGHVPASLLGAFSSGAAVTFSRNYMTGPNALAIEKGSPGGAAVSNGNFLDGSAGQQYRLIGPPYQRFASTGQAINLYPLLKNISAKGSTNIRKPMRPVSEYAVYVTPPALAGLVQIATGPGLISASLLAEIPYASGAALVIQILDNDGSAYSTWNLRVGTGPPPQPGWSGSGGGGGGLGGGSGLGQPADEAIRTESHLPYIEGYGDGSVRPDRELSREEAAAMLYRIYGGTEPAERLSYSSYADVPTERWSAPHIEAVRREKLMIGYPDGGFLPVRGMARNEFAALLCRLAGIGPVAERPEGFPLADVPENWAAPHIYAAYGAGLVQGYGDGTFRGGRNVMRAEAAAMLNAALARKPIRAYWDNSGENPYSDLAAGHWAYYDILEASAAHSHAYEDAPAAEAGEGARTK